ncbi:MAG: division/cell wall cluster transcriptional repressor MraZ [Clostridia bacterium]|nr:division/cell wall cluster transcriptional repressor MraZ [Clostridia bacterium]
MLMGIHENSIDAKNRIAVPAKFREELGSKCILTRGLDDCLILYPIKTWEQQQKKLAVLPKSDKSARAFLRYIYANAEEVDVDKQGRIVLSARYRELAHIEKELVTIGMLDRIEVWAKQVYDADEKGGKLSPEDFNQFSETYQV